MTEPPPPRRPQGYGTVTARMVVTDAFAAVDFLRVVFGARGAPREGGPAEMRIGDSTVLVSGSGPRHSLPAFLYVSGDDVDATHARALAAGATEVEAPRLTPYGDRRGMVRDRFGNVFQVAARAQAG